MGAFTWKILGSLVKKGLGSFYSKSELFFCLSSLTSLLGNDFKYPDVTYYKRKRISWVNAHGGRMWR